MHQTLFVECLVVCFFFHSLEYYMKEQAHALKYQGEKKIKKVASSREV